MSQLPKYTGFKKIIHLTKNFSIAILITGIVFKIENWAYWESLITIGALPLVFLYILYALDIPHEHLDWTKAYPELAGMDSNRNNSAEKDANSSNKK